MKTGEKYLCVKLCAALFSGQCFTFLSCSYEKIKYNLKWQINIRTFNNKNLLLLIHQTKTPHLLANYFNLKLNKTVLIEYQITEEVLLPFPYNCYDYEQIFANNSSPKLKEDCILKYSKQMMYKKCKYNHYWFKRVI